jgi:membrane-bound lytic murein transglycosylase A
MSVCPLRPLLLLLVSLAVGGVAPTVAESNLIPVSFEALSDQRVFDRDIWAFRGELLRGAGDNIAFLTSLEGTKAYEQARGFTIDKNRVHASLVRFRKLLAASQTSQELRYALQREFQLYRSIGSDGVGTVKFTGYFQPIYKAHRRRSEEYQYPVFEKPYDFESWQHPHPTRVQLEGYDGKGGKGTMLHGFEIAWLKTRYEAFMIHVQGSAILEFNDGTQTAVGYAAGTDYPFRGVSREFLRKQKVAWGNLPSFFSKNADLLNEVLAHNNRYILFDELDSAAPRGSIGVTVRAGRSIATDKKRLPPGALGLIRTYMPQVTEAGTYKLQLSSRIVLDQDTGSAIKGPGRVDLFMGTGDQAQREANMMFSKGQLYYLLLKG